MLLVAAGLAGCTPSPAPAPTGRATPHSLVALVPITDPRVLAVCPPVPARHLDGIVAPTDTVSICRAGVSMGTDGLTSYGPWQTAVVVPHPAALITAYRRPDARIHAGACTMLAADPLLIWIDRGGDVTSYYAPVDGCGAPTRPAAAAYARAGRDADSLWSIDTGDPSYRAPASAPAG